MEKYKTIAISLLIGLFVILLIFTAYKYTNPAITAMVVSDRNNPDIGYKQSAEPYYIPQCDEACVKSGFTGGTCKVKCNDNEVLQKKYTVNCSVQDSATLVIGSSDAIEAYSDSNPYIGEDKDNPDWIWILKDLRTNAATYILDTNNETSHSGPRIGIKNAFRAVNLDSDEQEQAKGAGGSFCLPGNYICIKFNSTTVTDYATYKVEYTTVDLSKFGASSTKPAILVRSYDVDDGLKLVAANLTGGITSDKTTDYVWIAQNVTNTTVVYYEDVQNQLQFAGYLNFTNISDFNIIDINYGSTINNRVEIDLRGDIAISDNLTLTFDIHGKEGASSVDGKDDLTLRLSHASNGDFDGVGATPGTSEATELIWGLSGIQLGLKEVDLLMLYGISIQAPKTDLANDRLSLEIPDDQVMASVVISGAVTEELLKKTSIRNITNLTAPTFRDDEIANFDNHMLLIGGPVVNDFTRKYIPEWEYKDGEAIIMLLENNNTKKEGKKILIIAGTNKEDTKMAADVLSDYTHYKLTGTKVKVYRVKGEIIAEQIEQPTPKLNIAKYPSMFIEGDQYNLLPVYGVKADAQDVVSLVSALRRLTKGVAVSLVVNETETVGGNEISDDIAFGSNISEAQFFDPLLQYDDIATLTIGTNTLSGNAFDYREVALLFQGGPSIQTSLSSSDDEYGDSPYMELEAGRLRYYYSFEDKIDLTTIDASNPLAIKFLDNDLSLTEIIEPDRLQVLAKGAEYIMTVGDKIKSGIYNVTLVNVNNPEQVAVEVGNGTAVITDIIRKGITAVIGGLQIKNVKAFYHAPGARCCCFDALIYLS